MSHIGGKMCVMVSGLPTRGEGRLKHREQPQLLGSQKEHLQLNPEDAWYKTKAVEFHRVQICVDMFVFSSQYSDVATLKDLPKLTAGDLYYYPAFNSLRDGAKFSAELHRVLTRPTGFEAVVIFVC